MRKYVYILLFFTINCFSQSQKLFFGVLKDSSNYISDAHIINLNTKLGTISIKGDFKVFAKVGDTLEFSSIQHESKKIIVNKTHFGIKNNVIYLNRKTYFLDEFELKRNNLLGLLTADVNSVPKNNNRTINAETLGLPFAGTKKMTPIERKIHAATTSSGGIPFDYFLNVLSGRLKKLKEEQKIIDEDNDVNILHERFKYFLEHNFKIKKENQYRFLYYCRSDSLFSKKIFNNEIKTIEFLQKCAKSFKSKDKSN